jgi:hypothetical protein
MRKRAEKRKEKKKAAGGDKGKEKDEERKDKEEEAKEEAEKDDKVRVRSQKINFRSRTIRKRLIFTFMLIYGSRSKHLKRKTMQRLEVRMTALEFSACTSKFFSIALNSSASLHPISWWLVAESHVHSKLLHHRRTRLTTIPQKLLPATTRPYPQCRNGEAQPRAPQESYSLPISANRRSLSLRSLSLRSLNSQSLSLRLHSAKIDLSSTIRNLAMANHNINSPFIIAASLQTFLLQDRHRRVYIRLIFNVVSTCKGKDHRAYSHTPIIHVEVVMTSDIAYTLGLRNKVLTRRSLILLPHLSSRLDESE